MATFSERKIQRTVASLKNLTKEELATFRKILQTYEPEERNGNVGFLDLPAEIRNIIYHYVAGDAHDATAVAKDLLSTEDIARALAVRDKDGNKIRPGLFGTCREIFKEFHSIFYSPAYVKAKVLIKHTEWRKVTDSALLDAIVNGKHIVNSSRFAQYARDFEDSVASAPKGDALVHGGRESVLADGSVVITGFYAGMCSPWVELIGVKAHEWSMSHSCLDLGTALFVPAKDTRCALCMVSMGPERAASQEMFYDD